MKIRRAFTLIELMIVVALFSILAAIVIPSCIVARKRAQVAREQTQSQATAVPAPIEAPIRATVPLAEVREAALFIELHGRTERMGMEMATPYQVRVKGSMTLGRPQSVAGLQSVRVFLPFPREASEATDVQVKLSVGSRVIPEDQLRFEQGGVSWTGILSANEEMLAEFNYLASGQDRLQLPLAQAGHLRTLKITLDSFDCPSLRVPAGALAPTVTSPSRLVWDYRNLVADRALIVELPTDSTVDAKVLLLCRLVGLAVLLYGLGFWYLGELREPGRLARFNWGNFFLLALTYSFFFPALAVLSLGMGLPLMASLGLAAALSLPLLTLHVTRIVDFRFALSNLWLALMTLGIVVNGVFGGAYQLPIYLASAFLCVGFLTVTYRRWAEHRQAWHQAHLREEQLLATLQMRAPEIREAHILAEQASNAAGPEAQLQAVESARGKLLELLAADQEMLTQAQGLSTRPWGALRQEGYCELKARAEQQKRWLNRGCHSLQLALQRLAEARSTEHEGELHCLDCGKASGESRCCPHCGAHKPQRLLCSCGQTLLWPARRMVDQAFQPHCSGCGSRLKVSAT